MVIQLRSLATLSHRRSLGVGRAPGTGPCNTNSNEVVGVESEKLRQGGLELFFFFLEISLEDDLFTYYFFLGGRPPKVVFLFVFFFFFPLFPNKTNPFF